METRKAACSSGPLLLFISFILTYFTLVNSKKFTRYCGSFQDQGRWSPSLFPKLLSRSRSLNSNANAGIATQNEDSKANDSVYILFSCITGDRNCYTSATTSQTGQMFFVMHAAVTHNLHEFPWVSFWQCGKTAYEPLVNYVSAHFCWTKTLFKL